MIEGWDLKHRWQRARAQAAREAHFAVTDPVFRKRKVDKVSQNDAPDDGHDADYTHRTARGNGRPRNSGATDVP